MIKKYIYGKKKFQSFFERLFYISLKGMNYGNGSNFETSGEKYVFELLNKIYKNKNITIFDVGANKGNYTKSIIENVTCQYKILAFEPTTFCIKEIEKIENKSNLSIFQFGFSSENMQSKVNFDYEGSTWASINNTDYGRLNKKLELFEVIELKTIDGFCSDMNINKVEFMKIDIEGHEIDCLMGAKKYLSENKIDIIQFEFGLASLFSNNRLKDFFSILSNYDIYRIVYDGIRKIQYHEAYEIYLTTNYLAINKNLKLEID